MKRKPAPHPNHVSRSVQLAALRADSELQMRDLIRRRFALPMEKRLNFLRRRLPGREDRVCECRTSRCFAVGKPSLYRP